MIKKDLKRLAELVGIILGDGSICLREHNPTMNNRLQITLNSVEDSQYVKYVKKLLHKTLNNIPKLRLRKKENAVDLLIFKKETILFLINEIGLKLSPKWNNAKIPDQFLRDTLDLLVLRGYFDTDGCLVKTNNNGLLYPRLEMKICPSPMQNQFIQILNKYNFKFGAYNIGEGKIRIQLNGLKQLKKWNNLVKFSNTKHLNKAKQFLKL